MLENTIGGKVAIVTGGTRGIGRAIAERLLDEGARVAICGARQASVESAVAAMNLKGNLLGMVADVSKHDEVKRFVAGVQERFGTVDVLINCAGIGTFRSVAELAPEEWERMISVNLSGVYYSCHEVLPILRMNGGGDVINISSLAGANAFAGGAGYNATKFGLNGFSEAMMLDHRNDGVRVSYIMPGSVATEFGGGSGRSEEQARSEWKIAPEDVADVVVTLLRMPRRTTISRVEMRPSRPPRK